MTTENFQLAERFIELVKVGCISYDRHFASRLGIQVLDDAYNIMHKIDWQKTEENLAEPLWFIVQRWLDYSYRQRDTAPEFLELDS